MQAGESLVVFQTRDPLILVVVARTGESRGQLDAPLTALYEQVVFLVTEKPLQRLRSDPYFDLVSHLAGTRSCMVNLIHLANRSPCLVTDTIPILALPAATRSKIQTAFKSIRGAVAAFLFVGSEVACYAQRPARPLRPRDVLLLLTFVQASTSFRSLEAFAPVCLPGVSPTALLHAHVAYLGEARRGAGRAGAAFAESTAPVLHRLASEGDDEAALPSDAALVEGGVAAMIAGSSGAAATATTAAAAGSAIAPSTPAEAAEAYARSVARIFTGAQPLPPPPMGGEDAIARLSAGASSSPGAVGAGAGSTGSSDGAGLAVPAPLPAGAAVATTLAEQLRQRGAPAKLLELAEDHILAGAAVQDNEEARRLLADSFGMTEDDVDARRAAAVAEARSADEIADGDTAQPSSGAPVDVIAGAATSSPTSTPSRESSPSRSGRGRGDEDDDSDPFASRWRTSAHNPCDSLYMVILGTEVTPDAVSRMRSGSAAVKSSLTKSGCLADIFSSVESGGLSSKDFGVPALQHFVYMWKPLRQLTMCRYPIALRSHRARKRLLRRYQHVYDALVAPSPAVRHVVENSPDGVIGGINRTNALLLCVFERGTDVGVAVRLLEDLGKLLTRSHSRLLMESVVSLT